MLRPWQRLMGRPPDAAPDASVGGFWALADVSFDVRPGEALGVLGHNGSGKSTLLRILARVTSPTTGSVDVRGRVRALLEVGTGFHHELSGRENIYLSGAILGMRRAEIRANFDEIIALSGVERFLDLPVKRYSTGMALRLAFAVASHLQSDILLLDEILAVGDAAFQRSCLERVQQLVKQGRTILIVSHDVFAVRALCPRAVLLEAGRVAHVGPTEQVIERYSKSTLAA
ncbi:MAG TPA: ABC transporter ATP-binding protein [Pirellulales bacterium]